MARTSRNARPAQLVSVLLFLLVSMGGVLSAQATTVVVQGSVRTSDGTALEGASVTVENRETAIERDTRVNRSGAYRVLGLPPGTYSVLVRALGHRQQRRDSVRLVHGQRVQLDFTLERGAVELEPTIVQAGRSLDVQRNDVSTAVLQEEIENLPLNTRNVLNLAAIAPGIRTYALEGGRTVPVAGGLPSVDARFANLYVDGVDWRNVYAGGIIAQAPDGSMVPQEALREFRVYLNPYDVEFTRGGSYVISAITHRGSNTLEGSLFSFHQTRALVARSSAQARKPEYRRSQLGANVRGPLVRDRLFYSLSYESQITDNYIDVVVPAPAVQPDRYTSYAGTYRAPSRVHNGLLRLTAPVGSHSVDAMLAVRNVSREAAFGEYAPGGRLVVRDAGPKGTSTLTNLQLRDTYTRASFVNELSLHLLTLRNVQDIINPGPTLRYPSIITGNQLLPTDIKDRHIKLINRSTFNLSGRAGQHVLKSGVELSDVWPRIIRPNFSRGWFDFATDTSTMPASAQIGVAGGGVDGMPPGGSQSHGWSIGLYLQDEWRPMPRFSVTAGVRWDADVNTMNQNVVAPWAFDTTLHRALGEGFLNTGDRVNDLDNVAPRIALSWDVFGNSATFLRAGYGVMFDRVPLLGSIPEAREIGWTIYSIANPGTTDPEQLRQLVAAGGGTARRNLLLIKDDLETPAAHQWSIGVGRKFGGDVAVNLDYLDQRVRDVYVTLLVNRAPNRFAPNYRDITLWDDIGDARYRALLVSLIYDRRPTRVSVAYTLGKAESEFGRTTDSNYPDAASYAMQRSEADEKHRIVVSGLTRVPFGLEVSGLAIVASPRPFLVTTGPDANANGNEFDDWPHGVRTHRREGWDHWYRTLDLRVAKSIPAARARITVIAEIFNVFNTANHAEYQPNQSQPLYGEPIGDYARRQAQLGLRYSF